jgi:uncharacterized protein (TIGR02466 family)
MQGSLPLAQAQFTFRRTNLLFPTPVVAYAIEDAERINALLLEEIAARRKTEDGIVRSNRKGWHSESDFFTRKDPAHAELAQAIRNAARDATARVAAEGTQLNQIGMNIMGWVNVNPSGAYNMPHDHPGSFWSGCYYVKNDKPADPGGGDITFIDARSAPAGQPVVQAPVFRALHSVHPQPGSLLLFPSSLKHLVNPNDSEEDRVTIAFNVFLFPAAPAAPRRS